MDESRFDAIVAQFAGMASRRAAIGAALGAIFAVSSDDVHAAAPSRSCHGLQQPCATAKACCQPNRGKVACRAPLGAPKTARICCGLAKVGCTTSDDCCLTFGCDRDAGHCVSCRPGGASCVTGGVTDGGLCCSLVETNGICGPSCRTKRDCATGQQCCSWQATYPRYPFGYCSESCTL